jgi:tripartite-type tricarboxylate transporter receptor subunit TctC
MTHPFRAHAVLALAVAVSTAALSLIGAPVLAQSTYPDKPVRLIVAYPPGGTSDIVGRALAAAMGVRLKQTFVVENKAGAGGMIGTDAVAKAPPDGYTISVAASGPISYLPALSTSLPYDIRKDFEPIANVVTVPNLMVVNPALPINSLTDLVSYAKASPGKVNFGSAGVGSSGHISGELFNLIADVKMVHVPYRGSGPALVALLGGETAVMFENLPSALSHARGGKLRGIAVLSKKRSPSAPEFPTTAELGMPDLVIASSTGLLAPKGTPKEAIAVLERTVRAIAADPEMVKVLSGFGADIDFLDAVQYRAYMEDEIKRWTVVGRRANISVKP